MTQLEKNDRMDISQESSEEVAESSEVRQYLNGILLSAIPYIVTVLLASQYVSRSDSKCRSSSDIPTPTPKRKLCWLFLLLSKRQISWQGIKLSWTTFWKELPVKVWILYVESFYVPKYRKEWNKYCTFWHFNPDDFLTGMNSPGLDRESDVDVNNLDPAALEVSSDSAALSGGGSQESVHHMDVHTVIRHDHSECEIITICVNGLIFQTQKKTLERFPFTLLGNEVLREQFYDPVNRYYFLDRNRSVFDSVLFYYQSGGVLRRPDHIPLHIFMQEIEFYQVDERNMARFRENEYITEEKIPDVPAGLLGRKLWCLFEFAGSSLQARIVSFISFFVVIISLVTFCVDSLPTYNDDFTIVILDGEAISMRQNQNSFINFQDPIDILEFSCVAWFCFEILVRFLSCPSAEDYFTDMLNVTDILSVIPWFVTLGSMIYSMVTNADSTPDLSERGRQSESFLSLLKAVRLIRVLRILKLSRHSSGLQILGKTLLASVSELVMLVFFIVIGVLVFSSMMYYSEFEEPETPFTSIPLGFWWGVCTMTTVGYGDDVPKGVWGKLVGSIAALAGLLTIALPVPVIVNNFKFFCNQNFNKSEINLIQTNHVMNCPCRPSGYLFHVDPEMEVEPDNVSQYEILKYEHRDTLKKYREFEARANADTKRRATTVSKISL